MHSTDIYPRDNAVADFFSGVYQGSGAIILGTAVTKVYFKQRGKFLKNQA